MIKQTIINFGREVDKLSEIFIQKEKLIEDFLQIFWKLDGITYPFPKTIHPFAIQQLGAQSVPQENLEVTIEMEKKLSQSILYRVQLDV